MTTTLGYAVLDPEGNILLKTVTDTERGAKVNWLWVYASVRVMNHWKDHMIAEAFEKKRGKAELVQIEIKIRGS